MPVTQQDFSREQGGDEALGKVADLVVGIPVQRKAIFQEESERHASVAVFPSNHEDHGVDEDEERQQIGERELAIGEVS